MRVVVAAVVSWSRARWWSARMRAISSAAAAWAWLARVAAASPWRARVEAFCSRMTPGSYLVVSHATSDGADDRVLPSAAAAAPLDIEIPIVLDTDGMRTRQSREEQVERNRGLVLAAARRVFLARGYINATLDAIAEEAGFSKGVVYSQFESKADMFLALLEARISERLEQSDRLAAQLDGRDLAEAVTDLALALHRAEPEWTHLVLEFRLHAARVPALSERYKRLHERTIDGLAGVFARLHERAGSTPRYPVRVLAELALGIDVGGFLERLASPAADALPFPQVISELVMQTAPTARHQDKPQQDKLQGSEEGPDD